MTQTIVQLAHSKLGGCVALRLQGGLVGVYAPTDEDVWEETKSADFDELRAKLTAMEPRQVAFSPDLAWTETRHGGNGRRRSGEAIAASRARGVQNTARARKKVDRA